MIRSLDVICALIGIIFLTPLFIFLWLLLAFHCGSPIFKQERLGKNRKPFRILKFRSMKKSTISDATHLVSKNNVTKIGHFLRAAKLDELPQLWNVLKGEMSLVGPRPGLPNQVELTQAREKHGVFSVKPGITGISQVSGIDMSTPELLAETDARMISEMSVSNYFKVIILTINRSGVIFK